MATYELKLGRTITLIQAEDEEAVEELRQRIIKELEDTLADIDARLIALGG